MSPKNDIKQIPLIEDRTNATQAEANEIDLRVYWGMFSKYKGRIIMLTLLIGCLTTLFTLSLPPIYRSTTKLLIETDKAKIISIDELYSVNQMNDEFYQTQLGILTSRPLAEKVVNDLKLMAHKAFNPTTPPNNQILSLKLSLNWQRWVPTAWLPPPSPPPTAAQRYKTIVDTVMKSLTVTRIRNSQLVEIGFESVAADLAAKVPNTLAEVYIDNDLESRLQMTKKATSWLTDRLEELRQKLAASEKTLQGYLEAQQLVNVDGVKSVVGKQIEQISTDLLTARQHFSESEILYRQVQSLKDQSEAIQSLPAILNHPLVQRFRETEVEAERKLLQLSKVLSQVKKLSNSKEFESMPVVLENPLVQRLKEAELEAERKVSELTQRYGPKHPQMVVAQSELTMARANTDQQIHTVIASAEAELKAAKANTIKQIKQVVDGITKEYEVARSNMEALERVMNQKEEQIQGINRKEYQLNVLQREVDVNKQLYDLFLTRFKETDASQDVQALQSTIGRVIDPALVPSSSYKPKTQMIISISLVLGFMFALMLAFLIEYLDNTIKNGDEVEQKLGMPLLGILPKLKVTFRKNSVKPRLMFLEHEKSQFAEAIRTIRTGIMLSSLDNEHKIIVVTSSTMGEGKTTFAINQAFALGQMAKTLLIDADLRRPTVAQTFGFTTKIPGLSELVAGTQEITQCIHQLPEAKIDLIPSGTIPPNPSELLSSRQFTELLAKLSEQYTYIVIDTPPTHAVSDAMVVTTHASAVAYVVKADATPYKLVQEGIKQLRQVDAPLLGIVLNQVDTKKLSSYYNYKYGSYKGYHSYNGTYYGHQN